MSESVERSYFDAKFDGLEKLVTSQMQNLHDHIVAVSENGKQTEADLNAHKDSADAHGRRAATETKNAVISWISLAVAAALGLVEAFRSHNK